MADTTTTRSIHFDHFYDRGIFPREDRRCAALDGQCGRRVRRAEAFHDQGLNVTITIGICAEHRSLVDEAFADAVR